MKVFIKHEDDSALKGCLRLAKQREELLKGLQNDGTRND